MGKRGVDWLWVIIIFLVFLALFVGGAVLMKYYHIGQSKKNSASTSAGNINDSQKFAEIAKNPPTPPPVNSSQQAKFDEIAKNPPTPPPVVNTSQQTASNGDAGIQGIPPGAKGDE